MVFYIKCGKMNIEFLLFWYFYGVYDVLLYNINIFIFLLRIIF